MLSAKEYVKISHIHSSYSTGKTLLTGMTECKKGKAPVTDIHNKTDPQNSMLCGLNWPETSTLLKWRVSCNIWGTSTINPEPIFALFLFAYVGGWWVYPLLFLFIKCTKVWIIQLSSTGTWKGLVLKNEEKPKTCLLTTQHTGVNQWETLKKELLHHTTGLISGGCRIHFKA